jgi:hypothetical protein
MGILLALNKMTIFLSWGFWLFLKFIEIIKKKLYKNKIKIK